ncbi:hypothetical protein PENSPDRAFT_18895 [Peniophora sp. CONT]|nr:hypothetical protein PENSPDRAFT_18895 [Peniophora sp. CONT]
MQHCQRGFDSYAHACALRRALAPLARAQRTPLSSTPRPPVLYRVPSPVPVPAKPSLAMRIAAHPALAQMLFIILHTLPHFALGTVPTLALAAIYLLWQSIVSLALVLFAILRPYTPAIVLLALARVMSPALPAVDIILALGALGALSAGGKLGVQRGDSGIASPCRKARRRPPPIFVPSVKMEDCFAVSR